MKNNKREVKSKMKRKETRKKNRLKSEGTTSAIMNCVKTNIAKQQL